MSRAGVNFVRQVAEGANCTFQEIEQANDLGNDAYIEFVRAEEATGCCLAVQIKSGPSYVESDGSFVIPADRDHFEYWNSHILPVCGIVYNPGTGRAAWCDITQHLRSNPEAVDRGPFRIRISSGHRFCAETFDEFREHFESYQRQYSDDAHFAAALERFAPTADPTSRATALASLFSFHRSRAATWFYVASLFRSIEDLDVLRRVVIALSHLPGHGDIYWHRRNEIEPEPRSKAVAFMRLTFARDEVVQLLRAVDEHGFSRGTIGQAAHALISLVRDPSAVLRSIAFDMDVSEEIRYAAIFLFVFYAQNDSVQHCLDVLESFRSSLPDGIHDEVVVELSRTLREHGHAGFY